MYRRSKIRIHGIHAYYNRGGKKEMIEALSNVWFVVFVLLVAAVQLAGIGIEAYLEERK